MFFGQGQMHWGKQGGLTLPVGNVNGHSDSALIRF